MTTDDILSELADILGVEPGTLTLDTHLDTLRWDSMALLAYQAFLRFHFNKVLPNVSCASFSTVRDLVQHAN